MRRSAQKPGSEPAASRDARGLLYDDHDAVLRSLGAEPYRTEQVFSWLHQRGATSFDQMTNLPVRLREQLAERLAIRPLQTVEKRVARDGTTKYLFGLEDGERIETVQIPAGRRQTICLSSQVGCKFRCAFCASGMLGWRRDLSAAEIVGQVLAVVADTGRPADHLVLMGIGEPLDNYDAVLRAIRILNDPRGQGIGARRITISTAGLIPGIQRLAREGLQVVLSVSLHAPNDDLRSALIPINRGYPVGPLLKACRDYFVATRRQITFEYVLLEQTNDFPRFAADLKRLFRGFDAKMNVLALNPVTTLAFRPSDPARRQAFVKALRSAGIKVTVRRPRGADIEAACGQLRLRAPRSGATGRERSKATYRPDARSSFARQPHRSSR